MVMPIVAYSKIKPLRLAKGLKQAEVATELGISRPTYLAMEQGDKEPTISQLHTLSRLLGVEIGDLCSNLPPLVSVSADYAKFKDLVSTCLINGSEQGEITKTKLAILCYLADFAWFRLGSTPMTGITYRCTNRGPAADDYFRAIDELYEAQAIGIESRGTSMIIRTIEKRQAKLLNKEELALIGKICAKWRAESTESLVKFVQEQTPCKTSKPGQPLAYETIINQPKDLLY